MKKLFTLLGIALLALLAYLAFWPVSVAPVAWEAPPDQGYTGDFAVNDRLTALKIVELEGRSGPEDADFGPDGLVHVATHDGEILRI